MFTIINFTWLTVLTVDLLATSGDITITWTSPILPKLYSNDTNVNPFHKPITASEDSWIGSLINIGAIIGPFPFGFISEKFGRKIALLSIAIPHMISYITLACSHTVNLYYFARFLGGIAVGGGYTLLPMYVAEIAEDSNRGMMSSTLGIFWAFGNFMPYFIGPYISIFWFNIILACVPATFFALSLLILPESPYYLIMKENQSCAENALKKLRNGNQEAINVEVHKIRIEIKENHKITLSQFFKSKIYLKGLLISLVLIIAQQFSAIDAVLFYTQEIFDAAGATDLSPEVSSIIIGFIIFTSSFITPFLVEKFGRKLLLLISFAGVAIGLCAIGTYFYIKLRCQADVHAISWLPIVSLVLYIFTFSVGLGPLPWTMSSELFPTSVKLYTAIISSCTCFTASFLVTKYFNSLTSDLGEGETFWLFGACSILAFIFTMIYVPETKGKSFQEIQKILEHH